MQSLKLAYLHLKVAKVRFSFSGEKSLTIPKDVSGCALQLRNTGKRDSNVVAYKGYAEW
jgi:hypothetical protein